MSEELHNLFEKYLHDELTEAEKRQLAAELEQHDTRRQLALHIQWSAMIARAARKLAGRVAELGNALGEHGAAISPRPGGRVLRYATTAALAAAASLLILLAVSRRFTAPDPATPAALATLEPGTAGVTLVREGQLMAAGSALQLLNGDLLEVSAGGVCDVYGKDSSHVRLSTGTQVAFSESQSGAMHIHLLRGRVAAVVSRRPKGAPLLVTAPHGRMTVLGTRFSLSVDANATRLGVESGAVRLSHIGTDAAVDVRGGHLVEATADGLSAPVVDCDYLPALAGYWAFDEPVGDVAIDSSFGFHDGAVVGAGRGEGQMGGALKFLREDDHVLLDDATGCFGTNSFTVSLWVSVWRTGGRCSLLRKRDVAGRGYELFMDDSSGQLVFELFDGAGTHSSLVTLGAISNTAWHHVLVSVDRSAGRIHAFFDGRRAGSRDTFLASAKISPSGPLLIGGTRAAGGGFIGVIDDCRLYSAATPYDQVRAIGRIKPAPRIPPEPSALFTE